MRTVSLLMCLGLAATLSVGAQNKQSIDFANTIAINPGDSEEMIMHKAAHVVPTANQMSALENEFIAFIHFGPNTFTRMEWGTGNEDPKIFDLKTLDTDQWCQAMKSAGMKMVIITVKHHDGFCLWQSRYTRHGIMSTGFRDGKGDVLKDLSASCRKYGLKLGIYLSPADLYQIENPAGLYGNLSKYTMREIPREVPGRPFANKTKFRFLVDDYNEYFLNQLFELLTEYGEVHELWFDGAHPKRKGGQQYNYKAWMELIHTLAPKAVVFGRGDVRWCGNESGSTRTTEWNVLPYGEHPDSMRQTPDLMADDVASRKKLLNAKYLHYMQAETNTSIREGWFYRDDERTLGGRQLHIPAQHPTQPRRSILRRRCARARRSGQSHQQHLRQESAQGHSKGPETTFRRQQPHFCGNNRTARDRYETRSDIRTPRRGHYDQWRVARSGSMHQCGLQTHNTPARSHH